MNPTIPHPPGTCPNCSALQQQIEALDRGLVEAGTTASRALAAVEELQRWKAAQELAWSAHADGLAAIEASRTSPRRPRPALT